MWGYSTRGHHVARVAHTHGESLVGVVVQGLFAHHAFSAEWLVIAEGGEYYASLGRALCWKFGYESVERLNVDGMGRFSLAASEVLERRCCRLLLLSGREDSIHPVEDTGMVMRWPVNRGRKEMVIVDGAKHMGEPETTPVGLEWLERLLAGKKEGKMEGCRGCGGCEGYW